MTRRVNLPMAGAGLRVGLRTLRVLRQAKTWEVRKARLTQLGVCFRVVAKGLGLLEVRP